uniref:Lectin n=1 Tax=Bryopsis plumosa TaxID=3130 RepID=C9K135_BRYPL|nr:lectin [Bryopsis plumosa]
MTPYMRAAIACAALVALAALGDARPVVNEMANVTTMMVENVIYQDPVTSDMFAKIPMPGHRGPWYVCHSSGDWSRNEPVFGRCALDAKGVVEAYFPYGGKDIKWPSRWSAVLTTGVYWGKYNDWKQADCNGGQQVVDGGRGAVTVKMDGLSECKGWTTGKSSHNEVWFGCNGKEVGSWLSDTPASDVFPLCQEYGAAVKLVHMGRAFN